MGRHRLAPVAAFVPPGPPWDGLALAVCLWLAAVGLACSTGIVLAATS